MSDAAREIMVLTKNDDEPISFPPVGNEAHLIRWREPRGAPHILEESSKMIRISSHSSISIYKFPKFLVDRGYWSWHTRADLP